MRIATYNVNGVNGRLPVLLRWLAETSPDIVCLQELKTSDEKFPIAAIEDAGYGAIWHGQKSYNGVAILVRGQQPVETQRGLPGDPDDTHSRYIEADVGDIRIGCLYLPNGNPAPGPRFDYKLAWFDRLIAHAAELWSAKGKVVLAGDFNAVPTPFDAEKPERWVNDAVFFPETRAAYARLLAQGCPVRRLGRGARHPGSHHGRRATPRRDCFERSRECCPTAAGTEAVPRSSAPLRVSPG